MGRPRVRGRSLSALLLIVALGLARDASEQARLTPTRERTDETRA